MCDPRRIYRRRALIESLFSSVKRKLSARAPGCSLPMQMRQALLLDLLTRVIEGNASYARPGNNYRKRPPKTT